MNRETNKQTSVWVVFRVTEVNTRETLQTYLNVGPGFLPLLFCLVELSELFLQGLQHGKDFFLKHKPA